MLKKIWYKWYTGLYNLLANIRQDMINNGTTSCKWAPGSHMRTGLLPIVRCADRDFTSSLFTSVSLLRETDFRSREQLKTQEGSDDVRRRYSCINKRRRTGMWRVATAWVTTESGVRSNCLVPADNDDKFIAIPGNQPSQGWRVLSFRIFIFTYLFQTHAIVWAIH
jgi:hypothetical protein